jgi:branched-chain amino acid transport system ATP-binding protein
MSAVLEANGLSLAFGGLKAVNDFRLSLMPGDLQGLIGPNGAGKTTVFNLLTGVYSPDVGDIRLGGQDITGKKPFQIAAYGMARTFQNIRLFGDLTVLDNVRVACHLRAHHTMAQAILATPVHRGAEAAMLETAMRLLDIFGLASRHDELAKNLPYGYQRRLEIARAIATVPKVLLLDEPAAGMNPQEKQALKALIHKVQKEFGLTVLLIEHDMALVMDVCERITVLDHGVVIANGTPAEIQKNPAVIDAYLGEPAHSPAPAEA